jgi:hypothetical protein
MLGFRGFQMTITNKNDANKAAVLTALDGVCAALKNQTQTAEVTRATEQCARLQMAIDQFHAEGIRFAAYTLLHMVLSHGTGFTEPVHRATRELKAALETAGFPH